MHKELIDPVPLHEAAERLSSSYLGVYTRFALSDILRRRDVPILARRSDFPTAMLPQRVEDLVAEADHVAVFSHQNSIRAHYRPSTEREAARLFGPGSAWRLIHVDLREIPLNFDQVRICWTTLMRELRRVQSGPADEAGLRKLGLWQDSWESIANDDARGEAGSDDKPRAGGLDNRAHPSDSIKAGHSDAAPPKKTRRRDEKRSEIIEALPILVAEPDWNELTDGERCARIEKHLGKRGGWCMLTTVRRAINDYKKSATRT